MMAITHNLMAMNAERLFGMTNRSKAKSTEKLSSGYRINRAADDAAGLAISEKLRYQIRGLRQGAENTQAGISWCQIGDGAMNEISDMTNRILELSVKGATETMTDQDREYIDQEIQQLKNEIDRIAGTTTFNEIPVFINPAFSMNVIGCPDDIQVFDATYDDVTGEATFGGIVFHGNRITWDQINPNMVTFDSSHKQIFNEGIYSYTDALNRHFQFTCEDGARVPDMKRTLDVKAGTQGILVDGEKIDWSDLLDANGNACTADNIHSGSWFFQYHGAEVEMYFGTDVGSYSDMAEQINGASDSKFTYTWREGYVGNTTEQAVDVDIDRTTQVTDALATKMKDTGSYQWRMRADATGIWMEDASGEIADSKRTWAEMLINSWDQGTDISAGKLYFYNMDNGEISFSFEFTLSDITSVDSVIDGINNMLVDDDGVINSYDMDVTPSSDVRIKKAQARVHGLNVQFEDEIALGRRFDQAQGTVASQNVSVSPDSEKAELKYTDPAGNDVLAFEGDITSMEQDMEDLLERYLDFVRKQKCAAALAGKDPDNFQFYSLEDLVGKDNITTSGYLDEVVNLDGSMKLTGGQNGYAPGQVGSDYPCAHIDFANITDLDLLEELGFNSTCKTCSNHYSVVFRSGNYSNVTASGYRYSISQQGQNYMLEIDIESLKQHGVADGEDLAKALVEITDAAYDFHYTQYAAEGSVLYIYDNREQSTGTQDATFDTKPYPSIDEGEFHLSMQSDDGAAIDVDYTYNFKDASDRVSVEMQKDSAGDYVLNADGSYGKWDGTGDPDRYSMVVTYRDEKGNVLSDAVDADGNPVTAKQQAIEGYAQEAVRDMVTGTEVQLNSTDYTYLRLNGDENANRAVRPQFDSWVQVEGEETGIRIKHSGAWGDFTTIPRFAINTSALGISRAGSKTRQQALQTLTSIRNAGRYVAEKRALYGAYQNRLEHTYNNNQNVSENLDAADSRIRDTDIAEESVKNANLSILQQAGTSMLTQANQQPNFVLQLLQ